MQQNIFLSLQRRYICKIWHAGSYGLWSDLDFIDTLHNFGFTDI